MCVLVNLFGLVVHMLDGASVWAGINGMALAGSMNCLLDAMDAKVGSRK